MKNLLGVIIVVSAMFYLSGCDSKKDKDIKPEQGKKNVENKSDSGGLAVKVSVVEKLDVSVKNDHYLSNREPLLRNAMIKLPIGSIEPKGWLHKKLRLQADGFHGHLGEISPFLKKEGNSWLSPTGEGDHGWEEVPYWLKGYANCGYVLGDEDMIAESKIWIDGALNSQKEDGWFGPDKGRGGLATSLRGRDDLWPNAIMLFCLQDYYDYTGDTRVIDLMKKYFDYLKAVPEDKFLLGYWPKIRGGDLLFSIQWLYNITGDESLLELGEKCHRCTARWDDGLANWHNVNISQAFGEGATYYVQSKELGDLASADRNWREIRRLYGQVPGGMFGSDENCRKGYTGPRQAVETCGMVEAMLSDETLLWISGDLVWADWCEDVAYNSLTAALTSDMKALRYLTAPNHPQSDRVSKSPGIQNGGPMYMMDPFDHRCCQHNCGHGWPYFAQNLWMATQDNGIAAIFYSECDVKAAVGDGCEVLISEVTHYPFDENVELKISLERACEFPLYMRIPGWCEEVSLSVNGEDVVVESMPQSFIKIEREWIDGDVVKLVLPMEVSLREWTENHNSVSVDRGPLTYSLQIKEGYVRGGGTDVWPAWNIYPDSVWNYGLVLDKVNPVDSFEVVKRDWPENDMPFTHEGSPIMIKAKGSVIPEWGLDPTGLCREIQDSPALSNEPVEDITLVPMGAARIRISAFPVIGYGDDAVKWQAPSKPKFEVRASHSNSGELMVNVCDGDKPVSSADLSATRMTFWPHKGGEEWVECDLGESKDISEVFVYWFDDADGGGCRVPASWKVLYKEGDLWEDVEDGKGYGCEKDKYNLASFKPINTRKIRVIVQLKEGFSGGILEMDIK